MNRPRATVPLATSIADLAGLAALDLVLIPGATEPLPAYLAERLLPPAPSACAASDHHGSPRSSSPGTTRVRRPA